MRMYISRDEVKRRLIDLKWAKLPVWMKSWRSIAIRSGGYVCVKYMVRLFMFNVCLNSGCVPSEWKVGCIVPLYKG